MEFIVENLIYGGKLVYDKKDKKTKEKTGEKGAMIQLLEVSADKTYVNTATYSVDPNLDVSRLEVLKPCRAKLDISATSDFKKLISIEPLK